MPIQFACACGKQLKARDAFAGRRLRCPACQKELTIPGSPSGGEPPGPAAEPSSGEPSASSRAAAEAEDVEGLVPSVGPAMVESLNPWADRSLEQRVTPWQGEAGSRPAKADEATGLLAPTLGVVAVFLVLAGVAAAGWSYWPEITQYVAQKTREQSVESGGYVEPAPFDLGNLSDLDLVPRDGAALVSVRAADLWVSKLGEVVRAQLGQEDDPGRELRRLTGLAPQEIERATLVLLVPKRAAKPVQDLTAVLVFTVKPYNRAELFSALSGGGVNKAPEDWLVYPLGEDGQGAFAFLNDRVLLAGSRATVAQLLAQRPQPSAPGPLSGAAELAAAKHAVVVGLNPPAPLSELARQARPPLGVQMFLGVLDFRSATLVVDAGRDLRLDLRLTYPDADSARRMLAQVAVGAKLLQGVLSMTRQQQVLERKRRADLPAGAACAALAVGSGNLGVVAPPDPELWRPAFEREPEPWETQAAQALALAQSALAALQIEAEQDVLRLRLELPATTTEQAAVLLGQVVRQMRAGPP